MLVAACSWFPHYHHYAILTHQRPFPHDSLRPSQFADRVIPGRSRPSRAYQTYAFAKRSFYQTMNTKVAYFTDCVLLVFAGGMVGAVSVEEIQGYQLTMMTAGLISVVSSLKVFGPEKVSPSQ